MRTASDFNQYYSQPDPWGLSQAWFRDKALRRCIAPYTDGRLVLELGCGEGHLTKAILAGAEHVHGIDISDVAIARAKALGLANATFEAADLLTISFDGYDVITAIECLYYLSPAEQDAFLAKVAAEHAGKPLIVTGPIVGRTQHRTYFTNDGLHDSFAKHGISVLEFHNLNLRRQGRLSTWTDRILGRLLAGALIDWLPERLVNQRCYVACPK